MDEAEVMESGLIGSPDAPTVDAPLNKKKKQYYSIAHEDVLAKNFI